MSTGGHKIQRILLELTNSGNKTFASDEKEFSVLLNGSLSRALEELLDEADIANKTIQIPKLNLDLGTIHRPFQKDEIVSLFKQKLRLQLEQEVQRSEQNEIKESRTELDTLIYFLRNGNLPWWASVLPSATYFSDPNFITEFKDYFFTEATDSWVGRLSKQFTSKELQPLISELVSSNDKKTFDELNALISKLSASASFAKRKTAQRLLEKSLNELLLNKGKFRSFATLVTEFSVKDMELKLLSLEETSEYLEEPTLRSIPELIESKKEFKKNTARLDLSRPVAHPDFPGREKILLHYLSFGSLPKGDYTISKNELDFLLTEFILKESKKLRELFKDSNSGQESFVELLLTLPQHHFKTLIAALFLAETDSQALLKKQVSESLSASVFSNEIKTLAAILVLNTVMKNNQVTTAEVFSHAQDLLSSTEKIKLKEFFSKADPGFIQSPEPKTISKKEASKIDGTYFSDLLSYLFEYQSWPWWGNLYSKTYPAISAETSFEKVIESLVQNFESLYPALFIEFTRNFINSSLKPSLVFTKLNWEFSKKILDKFFPFYKNSLADTLEAILELVSQYKKSGIQTRIVTQQLLFFFLDQKKEERPGFKELVNTTITTVAVKLNTPLWEIYNILVKNYKSLALKNELTKEEAALLFVYHEMLEEQYVEESQTITHDNNPILQSLSEIQFISNQHEKSLSDYISGNDSAIKNFPSAWALGQFIAERLKNSPTLRSIFINHLNEGDFYGIYRILQLEKLSGQRSIANLLEEPEDTDLQEELVALLQNLVSKNDPGFHSIIRASLIKEKHFGGQELSPVKLKTLLKTITAESGIEIQKLESEILQNISLEKEKETILVKSFGRPGSGIETAAQSTKTFISQLRELEFKKHLGELAKGLKELNNLNKAAETAIKLHAIHNKKELLSWIESLVDSGHKKTLAEFIVKTGDDTEISSLINSIKTTLEPLVENIFKELFAKLAHPYFIHPFLELVDSIKDSAIKQDLLVFIKRNYSSNKETFVNLVEGLPDFPEKQVLLQSINDNFPKENFIEQYFEILKSEQKNTLKWWKEKLNIEVPLTEDFIQSSILKKFKRDENKTNLTNTEDLAIRENIDITTSLENQSEEKETGIQNLYGLSPQSIADIVIYFFFNREIPWWSPVKDIVSFEKLLQDISWSSPFILKTKFLETAEYQPGYFQTIGAGIISGRSEEKTIPPTKEELETALKEDLDYLSLTVLEKQDHAYLKTFIAEILSNFQVLPFKNEELQQVFRKIVTLVLSAVNPKALKIFEENESLEKAPGLWRQSAETALSNLDKKTEQQEQIHDYLRTLEEKYNKEGLLRGISITGNLFSIIGPGDSYSDEELLETWLLMLETFSGNTVQEARQEIYHSFVIDKAGEKFAEDKKETSTTSVQLQLYLQEIEKKYFKKNSSEEHFPVTAGAFSTLDPELPQPTGKIVEQWLQGFEADINTRIKSIQAEISSSKEIEFFEKYFANEQEISDTTQQLHNFLKTLEEKYYKEGSLKSISVTDGLFSKAKPENKLSLKEILGTWQQMLENSLRTVLKEIKEELLNSREIRKITAEDRTGSAFLLPYANYMSALSLVLDKAENISSPERIVALKLVSRLFMAGELNGNLSLPLGLVFSYLEEKGISKASITGIIETFTDQKTNNELQSIFGNILDIAKNTDVKNMYVKEAGAINNTGAELQPGVHEAIDEIIDHFRKRIPLLEKLASLSDPAKTQELKKPEPQVYSKEIPEIDLEGRIYVPNAGLVILWPFLSRLFSNLKYTDKGKFVDREKQVRAIHLAQYLVAFTEDHPEYTLVLNKLLCGMDLTEPVERTVDLTEEEKTEARTLLSSVIAQWKEMNNTSVENFQRTFIQREGFIWQKDGNWYVKTENTPFDILLLKLPWGLSIIKYPWNNYLIFVEWKAMN